MCVLSIISFLLWAGFLLLAAMRFGIPDMMSDVYYQLQGCTGSEVIGDKCKRNYGWVFTAVMVASAMLMLVPMLDSGNGIQCLAFLGCGGLKLVVDCDKAIQLLSALEMYALECFNVTASHKQAVSELTTIEEVEAYDYKAGYPKTLEMSV